MPIPQFIASLRARIGNDLLLVPTVVVMARDEQGRLLFVQERATGRWGFPGGIVEPNEAPADAAVREAREESGVLVELTHVAGIFGGAGCTTHYENGDRLAWVATVFGARVVGGSLSPDGTETSDARFLAAEQASAFPIADDARMFLQAATAGGRAYFKPASDEVTRTRGG